MIVKRHHEIAGFKVEKFWFRHSTEKQNSLVKSND